MDINGISVPDPVVKALGKHYRTMIEKSGQARVAYGRQSTEYALGLSLMTATIETIRIAYAFESLKSAHTFLRQIAK